MSPRRVTVGTYTLRMVISSHWIRLWKLARSHRLSWSILLLLLFGMVASGCGGSKRARSVPPAVPSVQPRHLAQPTVRILLAQDFETLAVDGARRASRLRISVLGSLLRMEATPEDQGSLPEVSTGFRLLPRENRFLEIGGSSYRGILDVFISPLGVPVAVNELTIEQYLRGVVPNELGPVKYPVIEALKAQAVAARTYTVSELGRHAPEGFDLFADTRSQAYGGVVSEQRLSDQAVEETSGEVAVYRGEPIVSMYSSTCGGSTEDFDLIFKGGPIDYLKGGIPCSDGLSPYHHWDEWIDVSVIQSKLDQFAGVGRLKDLREAEKSRAGRTVVLCFVGDKGEKTLRGNDIRFALGLRSNFIEELTLVKDADGFVERLHVRGKGWGHGVGLCQMGAIQMGLSGKKHAEILHHYYTGIDLQNWY